MEKEGPNIAEICARCQQFDINSIFDSSAIFPPIHGPPIQPIIQSGDTGLESGVCPFCRLVSAVVTARRESNRYPKRRYLRANSSLAVFNRTQDRLRLAGRPSVALSVESEIVGSSGGHYPHPDSPHNLIVPVLSPAASDKLDLYHFSGRMVVPEALDYNLLKSWLKECAGRHSACRPHGARRLPESLRVIDCDTLQVISWSSCRQRNGYFALSYVWIQKEAQDSCKTTEVLSISLTQRDLPQVVKDAIVIVQQLRPLGSRYLWVDQYCINQQDPGEKHDQISRMDAIYEGAFVTLVAALGDDTTKGLRGVGPAPRKNQPSAFVDGIQLVSTMPHVSEVLAETKWAERGWTYQEAMLSRRCLIFTDLQVYFACRTSTCCEAIVKHPNLFVAGDKLPLNLFSRREGFERNVITRHSDGGSRIQDNLGQLEDQISQYARRDLRFEEDSLDAFRGILSRQPILSYWGVPFASRRNDTVAHVSAAADVREDFDTAFAHGLCWKLHHYGSEKVLPSRKANLPSWSWAGWKGKVAYDDHERGICRLPVSFWVPSVDNTSNLDRLADLALTSTESIIRERSVNLHVEAYLVQIKLQPVIQRIHPLDGKYGWLCHERPNDECVACSTSWSIQHHDISPVVLYSASGKRSDISDRLWDALVLPDRGPGNRDTLLIIEWDGEMAQRVGVKSVPWKVVDLLPKTLRKITLR